MNHLKKRKKDQNNRSPSEALLSHQRDRARWAPAHSLTPTHPPPPPYAQTWNQNGGFEALEKERARVLKMGDKEQKAYKEKFSKTHPGHIFNTAPLSPFKYVVFDPMHAMFNEANAIFNMVRARAGGRGRLSSVPVQSLSPPPHSHCRPFRARSPSSRRTRT